MAFRIWQICYAVLWHIDIITNTAAIRVKYILQSNMNKTFIYYCYLLLSFSSITMLVIVFLHVYIACMCVNRITVFTLGRLPVGLVSLPRQFPATFWA